MTDAQATVVRATPPIMERIERLYLAILRVTVLLVATLVLIWAAWLAVSALYKIAQRASSVIEAPSTVTPDELAAVAVTSRPTTRQAEQNGSAVTQEHRQFYQNFVTRYYGLYRSRFDTFRRPEDKQLTRDEFDSNFVQSDARIAGIADGTVIFADDRRDADGLLTTMMTAASRPSVANRLKGYKTAKKRQVTKQVQRFRTETRRGWDSYSMSCSDWYLSPTGCATRRTVQVPYSERVTTTALPEGLLAPPQLFRSMQDQYFSLLTDRRRIAATNADTQRQAILVGNADGWDRLSTMMWVLGGFLSLIFFFLLIAIERHQRRLVDWRADDRQSQSDTLAVS